MKDKVIKYVVYIILMASLIGCGKSKAEDSIAMDTEQKESQLEDTEQKENIPEVTDQKTSERETGDSNILSAVDISNPWYLELPHISPRVVCYIYDLENPKEVLAASELLFVGFVEEYLGTDYENPDFEFPITKYKIQVLENLKGNLAEGETYVLNKEGGMLEDKSAYVIDEGDELPKEGSIYLFRSYTFKGELYLTGSNSNILLEAEANNRSTLEVLRDIQGDEKYLSYKNIIEP